MNGRQINDLVLSQGVCPLVDFEGRVVWFFPRGLLPPHIVEYLGEDNRWRGKLLRDHLVNIARGLA